MSTESTESKEIVTQKQNQPLSPLELSFCTYIEQVYSLRGNVPTFEIVQKALQLDNRQQYETLWNSPRVRRYLEAVGLPVERLTDKSEVLTPLQLLTINKILDFNDPKPDHKKLKELGVNSRQFAAWKRDPAFAAYLKARVEKLVGDDVGEVDRALFERAVSGDVTAIKFLKELTGEYRPSSGGTGFDANFIIIKIQEILMRHLHSDPELLRTIGTELEALANSGPRSYSETVPVNNQTPIKGVLE